MKNLYGFTLLRNGIKYDYPFLESLRGLSQLCTTVYVALGKSEDGTESALSGFRNLKVIPTVWDENLRKSGLVLSVQTNVALDALREEQKDGWGIYLQADEVLDPEDFDRIRSDIAEADRTGCDAVSFRYLHFWQSYDRIAVSRRWYPQEVRAIRLSGQARSYGDAQGFRPVHAPFQSDVHVYHYGHVRRPDAYDLKKREFHRWWHSDAELPGILKRGTRQDRTEKVVPYLGPHPSFMVARRNARYPATKPTITVYGSPAEYPEEYLGRVHAELRWTRRLGDLLRASPRSVVALGKVPFLAHVLTLGRHRSAVPPRMGSKAAKPWTREFVATLRFSEKGVAVI